MQISTLGHERRAFSADRIFIEIQVGDSRLCKVFSEVGFREQRGFRLVTRRRRNRAFQARPDDERCLFCRSGFSRNLNRCLIVALQIASIHFQAHFSGVVRNMGNGYVSLERLFSILQNDLAFWIWIWILFFIAIMSEGGGFKLTKFVMFFVYLRVSAKLHFH